MKQILLLRHAQAEGYHNASSDRERSLTARGLEDASSMAGWFRETGFIPERILVSTATRCIQTARPLLEVFGINHDRVTLEDRLFEASTGTLLQLANDALQHGDSVLMVAHNPGLEQLARHLAGDSIALTELAMQPGTLVWLGLLGEEEVTSNLQRGCATLLARSIPYAIDSE